MDLREKIQPIIELAAKHSSTGTGEIKQAVYDRAHSQLSDSSVVRGISKVLEVDCEGFFTNVAVGIGIISGMRTRLQGVMQRESKDELAQTDAYVLVDLWGRALGIEAMLFEITDHCEAAGHERFGARAVKARMAATFLMLEGTLTQLASELARRSTLGVVGDSLDRMMALIRAERHSVLGIALNEYLQELPA